MGIPRIIRMPGLDQVLPTCGGRIFGCQHDAAMLVVGSFGCTSGMEKRRKRVAPQVLRKAGSDRCLDPGDRGIVAVTVLVRC